MAKCKRCKGSGVAESRTLRLVHDVTCEDCGGTGKERVEVNKVYLVYGSDPNPDLGGPHIRAFIGVFTGTREDVELFAASSPKTRNGWTGRPDYRIDEHDVVHITPESMAEERQLREELEQLKAEEKSLQDRIKKLGG
jgi:hypothetical protein